MHAIRFIFCLVFILTFGYILSGLADVYKGIKYNKYIFEDKGVVAISPMKNCIRPTMCLASEYSKLRTYQSFNKISFFNNLFATKHNISTYEMLMYERARVDLVRKNGGMECDFSEAISELKTNLGLYKEQFIDTALTYLTENMRDRDAICVHEFHPLFYNLIAINTFLRSWWGTALGRRYAPIHFYGEMNRYFDSQKKLIILITRLFINRYEPEEMLRINFMITSIITEILNYKYSHVRWCFHDAEITRIQQLLDHLYCFYQGEALYLAYTASESRANVYNNCTLKFRGEKASCFKHANLYKEYIDVENSIEDLNSAIKMLNSKGKNILPHYNIYMSRKHLASRPKSKRQGEHELLLERMKQCDIHKHECNPIV